jgi:hypothetical protein
LATAGAVFRAVISLCPLRYFISAISFASSIALVTQVGAVDMLFIIGVVGCFSGVTDIAGAKTNAGASAVVSVGNNNGFECHPLRIGVIGGGAFETFTGTGSG